jgi:hypothetical protein
MKIQHRIVVALFAIGFVGELAAQVPTVVVSETPAAGPRANASIAPTFRNTAPVLVITSRTASTPEAELEGKADRELSLGKHLAIGAGIGAVLGALAIKSDSQDLGEAESLFAVAGAISGAALGAVAGGIVYLIRRM